MTGDLPSAATQAGRVRLSGCGDLLANELAGTSMGRSFLTNENVQTPTPQIRVSLAAIWRVPREFHHFPIFRKFMSRTFIFFLDIGKLI